MASTAIAGLTKVDKQGLSLVIANLPKLTDYDSWYHFKRLKKGDIISLTYRLVVLWAMQPLNITYRASLDPRPPF